MDSDGFLALTEMPKSAVIIGGGVIGIEFASIMNAFGCDVSIVEMMPEILPGMDKDITSAMRSILEKKGVRFHLGARVNGIEQKDGRLAATFTQDDKTLTENGEIVILSTGRRPVSKDVGFEALGLKMERGFVVVDDYCRTNVPNIYAIGDVNGAKSCSHMRRLPRAWPRRRTVKATSLSRLILILFPPASIQRLKSRASVWMRKRRAQPAIR